MIETQASPGEQIRALREAMRLSQDQFAEQVGVSSGKTVSRWERDLVFPEKPHRARIRELAKVFAEVTRAQRRYRPDFTF